MYTARRPADPNDSPRILRSAGHERGLTIIPKGMAPGGDPVIGQPQSTVIWLMATGKTMVVEWGDGDPMLHFVET